MNSSSNIDYSPLKLEQPPKRSLMKPHSKESYEAYFESPDLYNLNEIMIPYLDMEDILKLYREENYKYFEARVCLNTLSTRFNLLEAKDFKELLRSYDRKYATVRSYHYKDKKPCEILAQACYEGNIQAVINGLKRYCKLRTRDMYDTCAGEACRGNQQTILGIFLDLGVNNYTNLIKYAAEGGHLDLINKLLCMGGEIILETLAVSAKQKHIHILEYLLSCTELLNPTVNHLNSIMYGAGQSGDINMVNYAKAKGAKDVSKAFEGAIDEGHLELADVFIDTIDKNSELYEDITISTVGGNRLDSVKYLLDKGNVNLNDLAFNAVSVSKDMSIIKYLEEQGADFSQKEILDNAQFVPELIEFILEKKVSSEEIKDKLVCLIKEMSYACRWRYAEVIDKEIKMFHLLYNKLEEQDCLKLECIIGDCFSKYAFTDCIDIVKLLISYVWTDFIKSHLDRIEYSAMKQILVTELERRGEIILM